MVFSLYRIEHDAQLKVQGGIGKAKLYISFPVPSLRPGGIDRHVKYCSPRSYLGEKGLVHAIFPVFEAL